MQDGALYHSLGKTMEALRTAEVEPIVWSFSLDLNQVEPG